jgi:hypothetical protein
MPKAKRKIIEVVEGFYPKHRGIERSGKFGKEIWDIPYLYINCPNPDNFRKARITIEEL